MGLILWLLFSFFFCIALKFSLHPFIFNLYVSFEVCFLWKTYSLGSWFLIHPDNLCLLIDACSPDVQNDYWYAWNIYHICYCFLLAAHYLLLFFFILFLSFIIWIEHFILYHFLPFLFINYTSFSLFISCYRDCNIHL